MSHSSFRRVSRVWRATALGVAGLALAANLAGHAGTAQAASPDPEQVPGVAVAISFDRLPSQVAAEAFANFSALSARDQNVVEETLGNLGPGISTQTFTGTLEEIGIVRPGTTFR